MMKMIFNFFFREMMMVSPAVTAAAHTAYIYGHFLSLSLSHSQMILEMQSI